MGAILIRFLETNLLRNVLILISQLQQAKKILIHFDCHKKRVF